MTINLANNNPRIEYTVAQGVTQTVFSVPFEFFDDADLSVYVDGVLKAEGTDYTLTGGDGSTGTLTFVTATPPDVQQVTGATGGSTVVIVRSTTIERTSDFSAGADINRAALNEQLDILTAMVADAKDRTDRTIRLNPHEVAPSLVLPSLDSRKGKVLAFDGTTGAVINGPTISAVDTVSNASADIQTVADNIAAILDAENQATAAANSAVASASSASAASGSASAAATSASAASASASSASNSASAAAISEAAAASSESHAASSEAAALASEIAAAASQSAAAASASSAASSASAASTSEGNAASSASAASTSASNASSSAAAASTSASNAATSASNASAAADAALAALDSFDDRYLGQKTSDPSVDNDGNPLIAGALYFNITDDVMKVYDGSIWVAAYASLSGALIAANNLSDLVSPSTALQNLGLTATASEVNTLDGITGMSSQLQAEAGTDNATLMTPLRTAQAIAALASGGGGGVELTASGAITAGDPVGLNSDGTVSVLDPSWMVPSFPAGADDIVYDTTNDRIVTAYRGTGFGRAIVGTVSGRTVSYGTMVTWTTNTPQSGSVRMAFDSTNGVVVIAYRDSSNSNFGTAIVGTVSGTTITFGTPVVFFSTSMTTIDIRIVFDSANSKVVIGWSTATNVQAIVGTVSGTSISFGSAVTLRSAAANLVGLCFDSANGKVVATYWPSTGQLFFKVGTVSGTSISFGTEAQLTGFFVSTTVQIAPPIYDSVSGKVIVCGITNDGSTFESTYFRPLQFAQGTVSGTDISFGSLVRMPGESRVQAGSGGVTFSLIPNPTTGNITLSYIDLSYSTNLYRRVLKVVKVSGSSFAFDEPLIFRDMIAGTATPLGIYNPDTQTAVVLSYDGNLSSVPVIYLFDPDGNFFRYVGIASENISNGASGIINVPGQINESQTGLTVGARYFLDENGDLTTSPFFSHNREAGLAVSATKLLLTNSRIRPS